MQNNYILIDFENVHVKTLLPIISAGGFYVVSKDAGFDSLIRHMNKTGIQCLRAVSIEAMPCVG